MTNATIDNSADNEGVVLWQYDQAPNLIGLIGKWNAMATASTEDFWDEKVLHDVLNIDTASDFGLTVFGRLMGISWPTVRMPKPDTSPVEYEITAISSDLYRRLLKFRFFQMCKPPTIPNYNRGLEIMFPDKASPLSISEAERDGQVARYNARNRVLDFSNTVNSSTLGSLSTSSVGSQTSSTKLPMTMGFTFPENATNEEAYLLFQHYDLVYSFPAGICTHNSFFRPDRAIGFAGQNQRNFADEFGWADDEQVNGGNLAGTVFAGYMEKPNAHGIAFVVQPTFGHSNVKIGVGSTDEVWIDWGDGDFNYHSGRSSYENIYTQDGRYAVCVYYTGTRTVTCTGSAVPSHCKTYTIG